MAVKNFWWGVWRRDSIQKLPYILEKSQKKLAVNKTKIRPGTLKKVSPPQKNWTFGVQVFIL